MQILLDNIIFSLQKAGGISTYWYELASRAIRYNCDVVFFEGKWVNNNYSFFKLNNLNRKIVYFYDKFLFLNRFLKVNLSIFNTKFIFHSSYYRVNSCSKAINVVTVHDFIHEFYYSGLRKIINSYLKRRAIFSADAIITVSNNTKLDLLKLYPNVNKDKIRIIHNGVSEDFFSIEKHSYESNYFLFVGSRESYKNFDFVVKCVSKVKNKDLYIVGGKLSKKEMEFLEFHLSGRWKLFQHISNKELNILYNNAKALLYLSSYEGFGIPLLEAMKCGCPFIALNTSSIPEVAGQAGVLIRELNVKYFLEALLYIDNNRTEIVNLGFIQASKFSWDECFNKTLNLYNELLK